MQYQNLQKLIQSSSSSRDYFLSLPVEIQCRLRQCGGNIKTAADLHRMAQGAQAARHLQQLGGWRRT